MADLGAGLDRRRVLVYHEKGVHQLKNHVLFTVLKNLRGNARGCVYTEPLWGIPYNLYAPYISIYMVAIGLADKQIGSIVSISWGFQIVFALLSGMITDKLGRRRTTLIFDILSWSVPALISALAQNYWFFLGAGIINSVWRVTHVSWSCLLVEDTDPAQLVDVYTWIYIANIIVGFIAPLAGIFIGIFTLVPTMRVLYLFAAIMFTVKAIITYLLTEETTQGKVRMHETRHQSVMNVMGEYRGVFRQFLHSPQTLYCAGILMVVGITSLISGNFWAILVTEKLHIPAKDLALFTFLRSAIMLVFFFTVMPRINKVHYKLPLLIGFIIAILSQLLLITAPDHGYGFLIANSLLEACCFALIGPFVDKLTVLAIDPQERARIQAVMYLVIILLSSPFGWIAGNLSGINKDLPFILNIALFVIGTVLAYLAGRASQREALPEIGTV
jgi:DHA1 family tetracycline resistance protein-like MFS transporter